MRFVLASLLSIACFASAEAPNNPESPLTEHQRDILRATSAELVAIDSQYREQRSSRLTEQNAVVNEACAAIGVPEKAIAEGQCKIDPDWVDPKTKKKTGRVFWEKPIVPPVASTKK
jgi:hypothetical protein